MRLLLSLSLCLLFGLTIFGQNKSVQNLAAPRFTVTSIDGVTFDSAKLKGKVVVLNLWFVNCPNCLEEIKRLNELVDEYQGENVVFIGLATNKKAVLEGFLRKNPFKYNIIPSAAPTILSFGEPDQKGEINIPFPMHVVIDGNGQIVVRKSGIKGLEAVKSELRRQSKAK